MLKPFFKFAKDTWTAIKRPVRNLEREMFKPIPHNCHVQVCPHAAKHRDKNWHWYCHEHKNRGQFK